jgi:hypothetical protein
MLETAEISGQSVSGILHAINDNATSGFGTPGHFAALQNFVAIGA